MGTTGFRLNLKWAFTVRSPFIPNSSSSYSFRGKESSHAFAMLSSSPVVSVESQTSYGCLLKQHTCSPDRHTPDIVYSDTEELKIKFGKRSRVQMLTGENNLTFLASLQASKTSNLSLLMENLDSLEELFADSDVVRLEKDILVQLERLGALKLFHTCLSRTRRTPFIYHLSDTPARLIEEHHQTDVYSCRNVTRSAKKEERKLKRERASEKGLRQPKISSAEISPNYKRRRLKRARSEAEMSRGVKLVADLERIKAVLEEETGQVVSLSGWAEAARVDKKMLQHHLHFGWDCRDELLKSTRSLVLYIARNYKGLGVTFEDLIQAGNLGVLQGAERFDHTRGYKFSTYVQYWIKKSILNMVTQHARGIRIPSSLNKAINQIKKARKTLNNSLGKHLDDDEIAKFTGLSLAKITLASKCLRVVGSTDQKMGNYVGAKFLECTADTTIESPEKITMRQHMKKDLHDLLKGLDSRERQVLVDRFGLVDRRRKSLDEIGRRFSVSKEWIRKIEKRALIKLTSEESCTNLSHYLQL